MDPIVLSACEMLSKEQAFVLATIVHQKGSAPRGAGVRMVITSEQKIVGTIGGGVLEAMVMKAASEMTAETPARFLTFDLSNHDAAKMDMICGGMVKVFLDYIQPDEENRRIFNTWRDSLSQCRNAVLLTLITGDGARIDHVEHLLWKGDDSIPDRLKLSDVVDEWFASLKTAVHVQILALEGRTLIADPGQNAPRLFILGAGHVARPTAHFAAAVDFDVVVLDDRPEFASTERFPDATAVKTISGFDDAFENLTVDDDAFIVIVTRGHLHDRTVLAQALRTPAAYIGMIGSRRKRDAIFESLLHDGFTSDDIARVHSPIGLSIGANTPEEIAVSIVAELIAVRAGIQSS